MYICLTWCPWISPLPPYMASAKNSIWSACSMNGCWHHFCWDAWSLLALSRCADDNVCMYVCVRMHNWRDVLQACVGMHWQTQKQMKTSIGTRTHTFTCTNVAMYYRHVCECIDTHKTNENKHKYTNTYISTYHITISDYVYSVQINDTCSTQTNI